MFFLSCQFPIPHFPWNLQQSAEALKFIGPQAALHGNRRQTAGRPLPHSAKKKLIFPRGTLPANRCSDTIIRYYNRKVSKIKEESLDKPYENKNLPQSGEGNSAAGGGRTRSIYIISISSNNTRFCFSERVAHFANNARCSSVNSIGSFPSEKNCARVIPNALQIASNVYSVGTLFLLNKLLIVDCGRFAIFANLYSLHPRSSISSRICC